MPRKKNFYDSKSAETCPCGCCKWHSSKVVRGILGIMFILIVVSLLALVITSNQYFTAAILSFMGVIFLIVFIGWIFGFFCSCRGVHWARHGYGWMDSSTMIVRRRYANGELSKKEYDKIMRDLS